MGEDSIDFIENDGSIVQIFKDRFEWSELSSPISYNKFLITSDGYMYLYNKEDEIYVRYIENEKEDLISKLNKLNFNIEINEVEVKN